MKVTALTLLNLLLTARRRGAIAEGLFDGLCWDERALEDRALEVPWADAAVVLNRLERCLEGHDLEDLLREHVQTHPLLRLLSAYAASVNGWLDLWWALHSDEELRYVMTAEHHALRVTLDPTRAACPLWLRLMRATAAYAPLHLGARPLGVLRERVSAHSLEVCFTAPPARHSELRRARSSAMALDTIVTSLSLLGDALEVGVRDGYPHHERTATDEVSLLCADFALTPAEARVTLLLSTGRVPKEIAATLDCAVSTVRVHLRSVYGKTETAGQRELADLIGNWRLR